MPSLTSPVAAWYRKRREIASRGKNGRTRRVAIMVGVVTALIGAVFMFGPGRDAVADKSSPGVMGGLRSLFSGSADCDYSDAELAWYWCIVYALALLYALVGLAVVCDDFFVASLEIISERLNLSDDVAGATFMAAGSSAPELFTSVVDTFWSENNVGIGTIVGSAVFNILVIIAVSAAASSRPLLIDWRPLTRDCFFYLISIVLLIIFMLPQDDKPRDDCATPPGLVTWPESVLLVVWYALYIVFMVYNQAIFDWVDRKMGKVPDRERRSSTESNASVSAAMRALQMLQLSPEQREAIQRLEEKHKATKFLQDRNVLPNLTPEQRARRRLRSAIISVRLFVHFRKHYIKSPAPAEGGDELVTNALSVGDDAASPSVAAGAGTGAGAGAGAGNDASSQPRSADGEDIVVQIDAADDPNVGKEVREWLSTRVPPMDRYASKLIEEGFDSLVSVRLLNKEDLLMLGVKNGHCRTLLPEIQKLATELDGASSQAPLPVAVGGVQASGDGASNDDEDEDEEDDSAFGKFISALCVPWGWAFKTIPDCSEAGKEKWYILTFTMSIVWIGIISFILVEMATRLGCAAGVSAVLMGLTILAAGTSVPDALGSMVVARQGQGDMAVGNAIGSNVFDICLGLGLPYSAKTIFMAEDIPVEGGNVTAPVLILLGTLVVVFVALLVNKWMLTRPIGLVYLLAYGGFVLYNVIWEAAKDEDTGLTCEQDAGCCVA